MTKFSCPTIDSLCPGKQGKLAPVLLDLVAHEEEDQEQQGIASSLPLDGNSLRKVISPQMTLNENTTQRYYHPLSTVQNRLAVFPCIKGGHLVIPQNSDSSEATNKNSYVPLSCMGTTIRSDMWSYIFESSCYRDNVKFAMTEEMHCRLVRDLNRQETPFRFPSTSSYVVHDSNGFEETMEKQFRDKPAKTEPGHNNNQSIPRMTDHYGMKVTVVDWQKKILVVDMVSEEICDIIRRRTDDHVRHLNKIGRVDLTWRTLYTYTKMDIPCCEVYGLAPIMEEIINKVKYVIGHVFGRPQEAQNLRRRSWKEPHLLKYQKLSSVAEHVGVELHHDGGDITWQLMLSGFDEYSGGGTYFRSLRRTIKVRKGQVIIHPGALFHSGVNITNGIRQLVVCFMDGFRTGVEDNSNENDDIALYEQRILCL